MSVEWRRATVNLPNALTVGRIFLIPILVVVLLTQPDDRQLFGVMSWQVLGAAIFALASLTDWLDGYLARRRQQVTPFGQWMDPLADKLLVTAALISLVQLGLAPAWMVAIILGREFAVTVLRSIVHTRGRSMPASRLGKVKMAAEVTAILALILGHEYLAGFVVIGTWALWLATATALLSGIDYWRRFHLILAGADEAAATTDTTRPRTGDRISA